MRLEKIVIINHNKIHVPDNVRCSILLSLGQPLLVLVGAVTAPATSRPGLVAGLVTGPVTGLVPGPVARPVTGLVPRLVGRSGAGPLAVF